MPTLKLRFAVLASLTLLLAGCGGRVDKPTYRAEGTVTFKGKPVPAGEIMFIPDVLAGNDGSATKAQIVSGKYDTDAAGAGYIEGENIVRITGFDGVVYTNKEGSTIANGRPLFKQYEVKKTLEAGGGSFDFDVSR